MQGVFFVYFWEQYFELNRSRIEENVSRRRKEVAQIYFSKFNINSEIYKVYDDDGLKDKILKEVFEKIDENTRHTEREKRRGEEEKEVTYKFCNLIKRRIG